MAEANGLGFRRVAVLGMGLIGGSIALRLADAADVEVAGSDPDAQTRHLAEAAGVQMHAQPGPWLGECDLVVLAAPLDAMEQVVGQARGWLAEDAVLIDVGSAKEPVHAVVERSGLADRFVGTHPMAGTEKTGFDHAYPDLVVGVPWAVTVRDPAGSAAGVSGATLPLAVRVIAFLVAHLDARACVLSPEAHDASAATISHLPHVLANVLLHGAETAEHAGIAAHLAAGSFRDGTRVAGTNPQRTRNMLRANAGPLAAELRRVVGTLDQVIVALERGDDAWLEEFLTTVAARAEAVRSPRPQRISVGSVDVELLRSLLKDPGRAHVITA